METDSITLYKKQPFWPLMRVVGRRAFLAFFTVTFLVVAILAATNVVSKYALKSYTEDQIRRINWDAIAYQSSDIPDIQKIRKELGEINGVVSIKDTGSLKLSLGSFSHLDVEGKDTKIPWFMMMSSEDRNLLPPDLQPKDGEMVTALVGTQTIGSPRMGKISLGHSFDIFHEDPNQHGQKAKLFSAMVNRLSMPERLEIVKYFLDKFGSATFIPDGSLILVTPKDTFDQELPRISSLVHALSKPQPIIGNSAEGEGQTEIEEDNMASTMIVEIMHLISVDRSKLFTGWDLDASYRRVSDLVSKIKTTTTRTSFDGFVNSELMTTLGKMTQVSKLIGVLTILISVPILWLAWLFAGSLANLIILNQRRLVGLLRLRGASYGPIRNSLLVAIGAAGISGGLAGALVGTMVPYFLYRWSGVEIPLGLLFTKVQEPWVLVIFILLGTTFGLLAGRKVTNYMAGITPLEASRRIATSEETEFSFRFTSFQLLCLLLGGAKILGWILGFSPQTEPLSSISNLLNFVAAALFLYGSAALIVSRRKRLEAILGGIGSPLARDLKWFAVKNTLTHPHRIMTVTMVSALTFGVVVYPQITSRSFYEKTLRALKLNLGSDIAIRFDATELAGRDLTLKPIGQYVESVGGTLAGVKEQLGKLPGVQNISALYEFSVPGSFYIPGQNYLQLYLIEEPDQFLKKIYYDNKLGIGRPFREIMHGLGKDDVILSKGFSGSMGQTDSERFGLGGGANGDVEVRVAGTIYLLPGLSQFMMQDRESLSSASIEFINSISQTHPYVVGRLDSPKISKLEGLLAGVVIHVGERGGEDRITQQLYQLRAQNLIPPFTTVSTENSEKQKLGSDMFVYLALENIKVFMIGGLLVALAGLIAIAIVNFIEGKRIFALLRLRGASPSQLIRVVLVDLLGPLVVGACIGVPVGLVTGYGLTNAIFALPRAASILEILPVHLSFSWVLGAIVVGVLLFFSASAWLLSLWIFRRTAREAL